MEKAIEKAATLVEALSYIQSFRDKVVVIKLGGAAMEGGPEATDTLTDVTFLATVGIKPILVHGGGPAITREMKSRNKQPVFVSGRRVTDLETLEIVREVLTHRINRSIVDGINRLGGMAAPVYAGANDCLVAEKLSSKDDQGRSVDLGFVGQVAAVKRDPLHRLLMHDIIPVVSPVAADASGQVYNINADTVTAELAAGLHCEKLVYMSDTHGIYTNAADPTSLASHLSEQEISRLIADGVITSGMLPKVEGCLRAVKSGVGKAHIIDGRIPHSLLLEIFTAKGIGTEIAVD